MSQLRASTAIVDAGSAPYQVQGDPVIALVAQVNRFAGRSLKVGATCGARRYVSHEAPLQAVITDEVATAANIILYDFYFCAPLDVYGGQKAKWALNGMANSIAFVMANLAEVTLTIAQIGDSLGLKAADTGITTVDPKLKPKFPIGTVVGGVAVALLLGVAAALGRSAYMRRIG